MSNKHYKKPYADTCLLIKRYIKFKTVFYRKSKTWTCTPAMYSVQSCSNIIKSAMYRHIQTLLRVSVVVLLVG